MTWSSRPAGRRCSVRASSRSGRRSMSGGDSRGGTTGFVPVARVRQVSWEESLPLRTVARQLAGGGPELCLLPMVLPAWRGSRKWFRDAGRAANAVERRPISIDPARGP